ncbi:D-glycerate dehydrogenase [bacterium]|nr:D-glycerate dehydrogenase [bacterium]
MPKPKVKVFVTRKIPEIGVKLLKQKGYKVTVYNKNKAISRGALLRGVKGVDAILCLLTETIDASVLNVAGPQLKVVANYAVGYDNINLKATNKFKVKVTNTPGVLDGAVADHTMALMLAVARRVVEADKFTRAGKYKGWEPMLFMGNDVSQKTIGIIGTGRIGTGVAERSKGFNMPVLYYDIKPNRYIEKKCGAKKVSLDTLLKKSDFVSVHVPLLPSTKHLIGAKQFSAMKSSACLVNTSRGPVINELALVKALRKGQITAAALDVFEYEPQIVAGLKKLPNVILTPHIASSTIEARDGMAKLAAQGIIDVLSGRMPSNLVK